MTRLAPALLLVLAACLACPAHGVCAPSPAPDPTQFAYRQRLGNQLPMQEEMRDSTGRTWRFTDLAAGRPVILALGYYHCPGLCGLLRSDLLHALAGSGLRAGRDYELLVLSIDPGETTADAAAAKQADHARYPLPGAGTGWHYLVAGADSINAIAAAVGFRNHFDAATKLFVHPSGIVFLTPAGIVSGYRLGLGFEPADLRAGIAHARLGRIARAASPILLLCLHFDPTTGRYSLAILRLLQLTGALTVLTVGGTIALALRRDSRRR